MKVGIFLDFVQIVRRDEVPSAPCLISMTLFLIENFNNVSSARAPQARHKIIFRLNASKFSELSAERNALINRFRLTVKSREC